jgi:hypothetical protein
MAGPLPDASVVHVFLCRGHHLEASLDRQGDNKGGRADPKARKRTPDVGIAANVTTLPTEMEEEVGVGEKKEEKH